MASPTSARFPSEPDRDSSGLLVAPRSTQIAAPRKAADAEARSGPARRKLALLRSLLKLKRPSTTFRIRQAADDASATLTRPNAMAAQTGKCGTSAAISATIAAIAISGHFLGSEAGKLQAKWHWGARGSRCLLGWWFHEPQAMHKRSRQGRPTQRETRFSGPSHWFPFSFLEIACRHSMNGASSGGTIV